MENLTCPKCQNPKGTKVIFNHIAQFNCFACGYQCHMKHYRAMIEGIKKCESPAPDRFPVYASNVSGVFIWKDKNGVNLLK